MTEIEIPYRLYVYSSGSPEDRLSKFLHDVATPMNIVLGYGKLLGKQAGKMDEVSPVVYGWRDDLDRVGQHLGNLRFATQADREGWMQDGITMEHLALVRERFQEATRDLEAVSARTETLAPMFEEILTHIPELFETVVGQASYMRAMLESVIKPDFELPDYIAGWLNNRDRLKELAEQSDGVALEPLLNFLQSPEPEIRGDAADLLGFFKGEKVVDALIAALDDEVSWVRARSAKSLGQAGDVRAIEPLLKWKDDEDFLVKRSVSQALELLTSKA